MKNINRMLFKDTDRDGVPNQWDCQPMNPWKHGGVNKIPEEQNLCKKKNEEIIELIINEYGVPFEVLKDMKRVALIHLYNNYKLKEMGIINLSQRYAMINKNKLYREQNKDKIKQNKKKYYEQNRDKIDEKNKLYREQNKDKIKQNHKKYYEQNKDKIDEKNKLYREQNKDKIKQHKKEYHRRPEVKQKRKEYFQQNYLRKTPELSKVELIQVLNQTYGIPLIELEQYSYKELIDLNNELFQEYLLNNSEQE